MSFVLIDRRDPAHTLTLNAWTWRPLLDILYAIVPLNDERYALLGSNASGAFTTSESRRIATVLRRELLARLSPGERILPDTTITSEPDDDQLQRAPGELWRNYSVSYKSLVQFIEFCETSHGFEVT